MSPLRISKADASVDMTVGEGSPKGLGMPFGEPFICYPLFWGYTCEESPTSFRAAILLSASLDYHSTGL